MMRAYLMSLLLFVPAGTDSAPSAEVRYAIQRMAPEELELAAVPMAPLKLITTPKAGQGGAVLWTSSAPPAVYCTAASCSPDGVIWEYSNGTHRVESFASYAARTGKVASCGMSTSSGGEMHGHSMGHGHGKAMRGRPLRRGLRGIFRARPLRRLGGCLFGRCH